VRGLTYVFAVLTVVLFGIDTGAQEGGFPRVDFVGVFARQFKLLVILRARKRGKVDN
jgi:hypothetical protein